MTKEERELYHSDVKAKSDWNAGIRYAEKKARLEEKLDIAINLKKVGVSVELIAKSTGLSLEEVEPL